MRPGGRLISSLVTAVTMRLSKPAGGRLASSSKPASILTSGKKRFPPSSNRRISTAASPSAPPSPTRDGGASCSSKGWPLRSSSHDLLHAQQQQRGHTAAAAAAASPAAVADVEFDVEVKRSTSSKAFPRGPSSSAPLRVSFAALPRFETAFPNALSTRKRALDEAAVVKTKEEQLPMASPFVQNDDEGKTSTSTSSSTLAAAPHDSKLALFYNVYGPPPTEAAGRGESARAARDALALFHAVYGPPKHLQLLEEEEEKKEKERAAAAAEETASPSSPQRSSSLSPLRQQRATAASAAADSSSSPSSSSLSPRATTTIAPPEPLSPSSARRRLSFSKLLARGVVLERPNRFTMRVRLDETGEVVSCHCPVTGALGGLGLGAFEGAGAPCLVSRVANEDEDNVADNGTNSSTTTTRKKKHYARKTPFTVEAVSLADPRGPPSWVGINQMAANRYIEHFWNAGALPELSSNDAGAGDGNENADAESADETFLVRETRIGDTRSRVDFAASGGRDLVEVKCPLDALPLLRDESSSSSSPSSSPSSTSSSDVEIRPNPVLAAAAALRAQTAGERLARLPRAKRAAMYERAARHAGVLAEHLATAKRRGRAAAARARQRARALAAKKDGEMGAFVAGSSVSSSSDSTLESFDEEEELLLEDLENEGEGEEREQRAARALLIQCFQFDAPPVRGMLPPPRGADPSSDGRAAVAAAMRSAARAGVETWQVNMRFDERGVELLDCFKLDLFPRGDVAVSSAGCSPSSSSSSKATKTKTKKKGKAKSNNTSKAAAASAAPPATAAACSPSSFESFSSSFSSSSSSSSGDESDDGGGAALAAA
jgi:hypothetical protein